MSSGSTLTFHLPEGWTVRKVATEMVREWIPPFRAEPAAKAARWVVQSVVENPTEAGAPLWEPGISTEEYEARLNRPDLSWAIRASAGRGKSTILARLVKNTDQPDTFQVQIPPVTYPETLFDTGKMGEFLQGHGTPETGNLFAALLEEKGFEPASQ